MLGAGGVCCGDVVSRLFAVWLCCSCGGRFILVKKILDICIFLRDVLITQHNTHTTNKILTHTAHNHHQTYAPSKTTQKLHTAGNTFKSYSFLPLHRSPDLRFKLSCVLHPTHDNTITRRDHAQRLQQNELRDEPNAGREAASTRDWRSWLCCNVEKREGRFPNWATISADSSLVEKTPF